MQIRQARTDLRDRRLRLIHSGRLLTDGTFLYAWLLSLEERQRRATADSSIGSDTANSTWIHCSVGPKLASGEEETDDGNTQVRFTLFLC